MIIRNKKYLILLLIFILSAVLLSACNGRKTIKLSDVVNEPLKVSKEPYRIGAVLSLTGELSDLGIPEKNSIEMEVEKINQTGGVNGHPIKLFIEDDGTDPQRSVTAVRRLIERDKVIAVIGATGTGQSLAIARDIELAKVPNLCLSYGSAISEPVQKWVFQIPWPNRVVVTKVIEYLKSKGFSRVAIMTSTDGFGEDGKTVLEKELPKAGLEIVSNEIFENGERRFKSKLSKLKYTGSDALIVWNNKEAASAVVRDARAIGMNMTILVSQGNARREFIEDTGDAVEGVVIPTGKILFPKAYGNESITRILAEQFIKEYKAKYYNAPNGTFPGHAYGGFYIIYKAIERLNKSPAQVTGRVLRDEIERTKGLALFCGKFTYSPGDHSGTSPSDLIVVQIKKGKFVRVM